MHVSGLWRCRSVGPDDQRRGPDLLKYLLENTTHGPAVSIIATMTAENDKIDIIPMGQFNDLLSCTSFKKDSFYRQMTLFQTRFHRTQVRFGFRFLEIQIQRI